MESFKQRMQPTLDAMPAGQDKQTLQALIDYQDALTQPTVLPQERMRLFREVVRAQRRTVVPGKV